MHGPWCPAYRSPGVEKFGLYNPARRVSEAVPPREEREVNLTRSLDIGHPVPWTPFLLRSFLTGEHKIRPDREHLVDVVRPVATRQAYRDECHIFSPINWSTNCSPQSSGAIATRHDHGQEEKIRRGCIGVFMYFTVFSRLCVLLSLPVEYVHANLFSVPFCNRRGSIPRLS